MDFKDKSYVVQKAKTEFGFLCHSMDVTLFQTSKDDPQLPNSEVKINPFNMEKAEAIRETFDLGKLDWASIVIVTDPVSPAVEEEAMAKIKSFSGSLNTNPTKNPASLSAQLRTFVKVKS